MRQREIEEATQVRGVRPAVVDTWQEVGGEGQQEGLRARGHSEVTTTTTTTQHHPAGWPSAHITDDREVCEAR